MKQYILFDLDGTLINPWEGITNCVKYALDQLGAPIPDDSILAKFIGPPLLFSFQEYCGFSPEKAAQAIALYRERFPRQGFRENFLYDGIPQLLSTLCQQGRSLLIATSKPQSYAEAILQHHKIEGFFSAIVGPQLGGPAMSKGDVIVAALHQAGNPPPSLCVMVGDRIHDMDGAAEAGIPAIAAAYGYGTPEEFAYASQVARSPQEVLSCILRMDG